MKEHYTEDHINQHEAEETHLFDAEYVIALSDADMQELSNYQIWYVTQFWRTNPREYWIYEGDEKIPTRECLAYEKFLVERQRRRNLGEYGYEGATKKVIARNKAVYEAFGTLAPLFDEDFDLKAFLQKVNNTDGGAQ
jgi:hypothetical protein